VPDQAQIFGGRDTGRHLERTRTGQTFENRHQTLPTAFTRVLQGAVRRSVAGSSNR
jgi:hypothetical protein